MWKERPSLDKSSVFLSRIYREDIGPCLSFTRSEVFSFLLAAFFFLNPLGRIYNMLNHFLAPQLSQLVQSAVENNSLTIEPVAMTAIPMVKASAVECGGPK